MPSVLRRSLLSLVLLIGCQRAHTAPEAIPGTTVSFTPSADLTQPEHFYDFPFPSDLRVDADQHPVVSGFPLSGEQSLLKGVRTIAADRTRFSVNQAAFFRFDAPLSPRDSLERIDATKDAPILLIDLETSDLLPVVAGTPPEDPATPANLLVVAPFPGIHMRPDRRYAYVVRRSLRDAGGALLGVPKALVELAEGATSSSTESIRTLYSPLWPALDKLGVERSVAAATVFTTGDTVAETAALTDKVVARYDVTIDDLAIAPDSGASHARFCELSATVRYPQFQRGTPPYNTDGLFALGADGLPVKQREEVAPIRLSLPKQPMPSGGYPLVLYIHGSGGLSRQVIDRGRITEKNGPPTPGEGPAHVLAAHGLAAVGSAMPLNPERFPNASLRQYLNFGNLAAYRDNFRQGVIEQRLLLEALDKLRIEPAVVAACNGLSLPPGETTYRFASRTVLGMGQSMGAQYITLLGAVEPRLGAIVPTGSGGYFSLLVTVLGDAGFVALALEAPPPLRHLHPSLQLLQMAWEAADPFASMPRVAWRPLPGHPTRSIYEPLGHFDTDFPDPILSAAVLAYGNQQAGDVVWPQTQDYLKAVGRDGLAAYPVSNNLINASGDSYTGIAAQYEGDGLADPHTVFSQLDAVKHQYGCFFESFWATGRAVVPAPAPLGTACPR